MRFADPFIRPVNTSGVPRLTKFYTPLRAPSLPLIQKIFSLVSSRPAGLCNLLEAPELEAYLGGRDDTWRIVYRNYATLFFVVVADGAESGLGILDLIQVKSAPFCSPASSQRFSCASHKVFVESLDRAFENVCELDLVFHFDEVRAKNRPSRRDSGSRRGNYDRFTTFWLKSSKED